MKKHSKSIFIFRRDLRLDDNTGLLKALNDSEQVLPIFIFDKRQTSVSKNSYFSQNAFEFMIGSLKELDRDLQKRKNHNGKSCSLAIFEGNPSEIIESLVKRDGFKAVYVNEDYTPFAQKRDKEIERTCRLVGAKFLQFQDITLSPIKEIETGQGTKYKIFTPFMNKAKTYEVPKTIKNNFKNFYANTDILNLKTKIFATKISKYDKYHNKNIFKKGGREEALEIFQKLKSKSSDILKKYKKNRDFPALDGTSGLSAHHKFGTISIRETYWLVRSCGFGTSSQFVTELYWRDFYMYIAFHFPKVFGESFVKWGDKIKWRNNYKEFKAWASGKTGFPIVDAGMRQLNTIGWMHNRLRMIVASFLTKDLLIDWRWGEKYFAEKLVDYDPASNNGGWQWAASVGADPKPVRFFNPYIQQKKYDPEQEFIKKWIPELNQNFSDLRDKIKYPRPIVDRQKSYQLAKKAYENARKISNNK